MKSMQSLSAADFSIRKAHAHDAAALWSLAAAMRSVKEQDYFERNLEAKSASPRDVFIIAAGDENPGRPQPDAGWCILNWAPKYAYYKAHDIPETQDLNILPAFRRRGLATALIRHCEQAARARGHGQIGISVGLDASFGPAQRLYIKLGYMPDGHGVTYDRRPVMPGEFRPVDDNLCLMMVKGL